MVLLIGSIITPQVHRFQDLTSALCHENYAGETLRSGTCELCAQHFVYTVTAVVEAIGPVGRSIIPPVREVSAPEGDTVAQAGRSPPADVLFS